MRRFGYVAVALVTLLLFSAGCMAAVGGTWRPRHRVPPPAATHVDIAIFYDGLSPYGRWFSHPAHGWVWTPYDVPYGWRPYTHGHWIDTPQGWTWVSHWRWGWGPFHYGRWMIDPVYGWIWIPGTVWGPAWVAWRWGDDWIGWAPLPPDVGWEVHVGLRYGPAPPMWDVPRDWWCFTRPRYLLDSDVRYKVEPPTRNITLLPRTKVLADYDEFDGRPRNRGLDPGELERTTRRQVPRFRLEDAGAPGEAERSGGGIVRVFRPAVAPAPDKRPTLEDRVKPAAPGTTQREMQGLDRFFDQLRSRMEQRQREEVQKAGPQGGETLRQQHENERRSLEELRNRERDVRQQRMEKQVERPAPAKEKEKQKSPAKPAGKGKG